MKKIGYKALGLLVAAALLSGCGKGNAPATEKAGEPSSAKTEAKPEAQAEPEVITFWYNNKGDEALPYEEAIKQYNASQSKYKVEGLSVTDQQKLIVALASNESPDIIKGSNSNIITYQANGLLENLTPYVEKESYDMDMYSPQAVEANTIDGQVYALPISGYSIQLYYNKDILEEIGYQEPPKSMEEMYEMSVKATVLDGNGNIERLGYPLFPLASARQELIYGFGGRWWAEDGKTLTPESQGVIESLKYNVKYREQYGVEKVQAFIATANTNRYTEQDMFFAGKQLFRIDGSWLPTMMKNFGAEVNYGITLIPSMGGVEEERGVSRFETGSLSIPTTAKNKDGAWDFIKWITNEEGAKIIDIGVGYLPALKTLYDDPDILAIPGNKEFIEAIKLERGIQYPKIKDYAKYVSLIDEYLDYVYNGTKTPEEAMSELAKQAKNLS
ncbi:extracellular solute-binding protein [Clostridium sp. MCC353]|uniref:ABC transporter substrate-binding protein n=1 Tax=Clostridium sp. MCC353 TaxID=2592646 RepID=UPI001C028A9D|nr:ABC transporter substrate-binding protein [Clostridium sp. MCC353]MBT9779188.1 extracellular solute-binding protein [Clostridium sp. MCC353]